MKKTLLAFAAIVAALVSCQKEVAPASVDEKDLEARDCFVASLDQSTKTILGDSLQVKWAADDSIIVNGVVYGLDFIYEDSDSTRAEFSKRYRDDETPKAPFTAFFPAKWYDKAQNDIVVPKTLTWQDNNDFSMPMKAVTSTRTMTFENTYGVLAVKVEKDVLSEALQTITVKTSATDTARVLECSPAQTIAEEGNIFYVPMAEGNYDSLIVYANSHEMFSRNNKDIEIKTGSLYAFNYQISLKGINIKDNQDFTILCGRDTTLEVEYTPADATNKTVSWTSTDTTVITVTATGVNTVKLRAINGGSVKVIVESEEGGYTDTCDVFVYVPVDSVLFGQEAYSVELDSTMTVSATVYPSNASYPDITWTSLNTEKLDVDSTGIITAKDTGAVKLVATADGKSDTCDVNIICKVTSVQIDTTAAMVTLTKYDSLSLTVTVKPEKATNANVYWKSSNPSNVSVDATGKIQALEKTADSVAVIVSSAENSSIADTIYVKVVVPVYTEGGYSGEGIYAAGTWWAPVNCGYDSTDYKVGKLYQWGRKYGQGYDSSDATFPSDENITSCFKGTNGREDPNKFYEGEKSGCDTVPPFKYDWIESGDNTYWNTGTEDTPVKTDHDPCPAGWRVPTNTELTALLGSATGTRTLKTDGTHGTSTNITGLYYDGSIATDPTSGVFLPAAGYRSFSLGGAGNRGSYGYYWSSSFYDSKARYLGFYSTVAYVSSGDRAYGYSVRCVQE